MERYETKWNHSRLNTRLTIKKTDILIMIETSTYACENCGDRISIGDEYYFLKERGEVLPRCPVCNDSDSAGPATGAKVGERLKALYAILTIRTGRL
jgi:hypothetical protein